MTKTPKFKAGDRVRLVEEYPNLTLGREYDVLDVLLAFPTTPPLVEVMGARGRTEAFETRFELVKAAAPDPLQTLDVASLKPGDKFIVEMEVESQNARAGYCQTTSGNSIPYGWVRWRGRVTKVAEVPLKAGDKVKVEAAYGSSFYSAEILAIHGDSAWVHSSSGVREVVALTRIHAA